MCVIVENHNFRPSEEFLEFINNKNPDGIGIAFFDGDEIVYEKGIDIDTLYDLTREIPFPYVYHFRKRTTGTYSDIMCHPFLATEDSPSIMSYRGDDPIIFHNGTLDTWDEYLFHASLSNNFKIPVGEINDTRALAILGAQVGWGLYNLNFVTKKNRVLLMEITKEGPRIRKFGSWHNVELKLILKDQDDLYEEIFRKHVEVENGHWCERIEKTLETQENKPGIYKSHKGTLIDATTFVSKVDFGSKTKKAK